MSASAGHGKFRLSRRQSRVGNDLEQLLLLVYFCLLRDFALRSRPDVKTSVTVHGDFPAAPDALALAVAPIEHHVRARIGFHPETFPGAGVVAPFDGEAPHIVAAVAGHPPVVEGKGKVHRVLVARAILIEAGPRPRGKQLGTHRQILAPDGNAVKMGRAAPTHSAWIQESVRTP